LAVCIGFLGAGFEAVVANAQIFILDWNPLDDPTRAKQFQMAGHDAGVSFRMVRKTLNTHAPTAVQGGKDFQAVDLADDAEQRRQVGEGALLERLLA
jgi:hypothetical protein